MSERIAIIQQGLASPFWQQYLLPLLQERAKAALTALAMKSAEDDDVKRGRFQEAQFLINAPANEVAVWQANEDAAAAAAEVDQHADYRAEHGFRSPYREEPAIGALTQDESAATG